MQKDVCKEIEGGLDGPEATDKVVGLVKTKDGCEVLTMFARGKSSMMRHEMWRSIVAKGAVAHPYLQLLGHRVLLSPDECSGALVLLDLVLDRILLSGGASRLVAEPMAAACDVTGFLADPPPLADCLDH
jgi:hypothetical protein